MSLKAAWELGDGWALALGDLAGPFHGDRLHGPLYCGVKSLLLGCENSPKKALLVPRSAIFFSMFWESGWGQHTHMLTSLLPACVQPSVPLSMCVWTTVWKLSLAVSPLFARVREDRLRGCVEWEGGGVWDVTDSFTSFQGAFCLGSFHVHFQRCPVSQS